MILLIFNNLNYQTFAENKKEDKKFDITSDSLSINSKDNSSKFEGNVVIKFNNYTLHTKLLFLHLKKNIVIPQSFTITGDGITITGDKATYDFKSKALNIEGNVKGTNNNIKIECKKLLLFID